MGTNIISSSHPPKKWADAAQYAKLNGGYLVHINNKLEQKEIEQELDKIAGQLVAADSESRDGGYVSYLWIGATDQATEKTWVWDGDNTQPLGNGLSKMLEWHSAGVYHNWGKEPSGEQIEPDNIGDQNFAGIAFANANNWPWLGDSKYQWNDLNGSKSTLYFIVEVE